MIANGLSAVGLAFVIGSLVAPLIDLERQMQFTRMLLGAGFGFCLLVAAFVILGYISPQET